MSLPPQPVAACFSIFLNHGHQFVSLTPTAKENPAFDMAAEAMNSSWGA